MEHAVPARIKVRTMRQPAQRAADRGHRKVRTDCDHERCKACMRRWAQGDGKGPGLGAGVKKQGI